jgi:hypothetical protein
VVGLDVLQPPGCRTFVLKAMLMWTIHDFLGYGLVSSCQHQGYKACPPYGGQVLCLNGPRSWGRLFLKEANDGCKGTTFIEHTQMQHNSLAKKSFG